jgi:hypothetical protein
MANAPDSPRLIVLKALTAHLETVTIANGYYHDLAGRVYRGRALFGDSEEDKVPMLSLLEAPRAEIGLYADDEKNTKSEQWQLQLQGWVDDDVKNPTDPAYALAYDVQKCINRLTAVNRKGDLGEPGKPKYPDSYLLGRLVSGIEYSSPIIRPPTEGLSSKAFFYLPLRVGLVSEVG